MGTKKIIFIVTGVLLTAAISLLIYRYYLLNKKSSLCDHIPAQANMIVYFNSRIIWQNVKDTGALNTGKNLLKQNPYLRNIRDLKSSGIDLLSDLALVEYANFHYFVALLNKPANFEKYISESEPGLYQTIEKKGNLSLTLSSRDSFRLIWNDKQLVLIPKSQLSKCTIRADDFMNVEPEGSFSRDKTCGLVKNDTAAVWFYCRDKTLYDYRIENTAGIISLNNGIRISAENHPDGTINQIQYEYLFPDSINYLHADSGITIVNKLIKELSVLNLGNSDDAVIGIDFDRCEKTLVLGGMHKKEIRSYTYEYDDNFNKSLIVKVNTDSFQSAVLSYRYSGMSQPLIIYNSNDSMLNPGIETGKYLCLLSVNQDIFKSLLPLKTKFRLNAAVIKTGDRLQYNFKLSFKNLADLFSL